jgi:hypothetical protein
MEDELMRLRLDNEDNLVDELRYARSMKARFSRAINEIKGRFLAANRERFFGTAHEAYFRKMTFKKLNPDRVREAIERLGGEEECARIWESLFDKTEKPYLYLKRRSMNKADGPAVEKRIY